MSRLTEILKSLKPDKTHRLRVIILCVFAATTFWILNALNENYSTTIKYPLEFIYDRETYIAVEKLPDNIHVNVSGLGWNLFRNSVGIRVTPLRIILEAPTEIKKITSGALPALIADQMNDVELNYVITDTLNINIDERITRKFLLKVDSADISLEDNYRITTPVTKIPDSVTLEGPQDILTGMSDTLLVQIPQTDIDGNFKEAVPINTPDNNLIKRIPSSVQVSFNAEEFVHKQLSIPLKTVNFPESGLAYIKENAVPVEYVVSLANQEKVSTDKFEVIVDYKTMNPADSIIIPELKHYPNYLQEVSLDTTLQVKVHFNEE